MDASALGDMFVPRQGGSQPSTPTNACWAISKAGSAPSPRSAALVHRNELSAFAGVSAGGAQDCRDAVAGRPRPPLPWCSVPRCSGPGRAPSTSWRRRPGRSSRATAPRSSSHSKPGSFGRSGCRTDRPSNIVRGLLSRGRERNWDRTISR